MSSQITKNKYDSRTGHARVKVKPVSVREWMQALNPNKQTCIGKEADVSPQTKQTNLYRCGSEEVALTLAEIFGTKFVIDRHKDRRTAAFIEMLSHVKTKNEPC